MKSKNKLASSPIKRKNEEEEEGAFKGLVPKRLKSEEASQ
jgi:hypothetical protein